MMTNREIKFKGKRVDNGEWIYGFLDVRVNDVLIRFVGDNNENDYQGVDPETVGQFIGLLDKEGVEIYEGDICRVKEDGNEYDHGTLHRVQYWDQDSYPAFDFEPPYDEDANGIQCAIFGSSIEVIGNTHDNPEPMEAGQ